MYSGFPTGISHTQKNMKFDIKGHAAMFTANAMWGLMSPISKAIMLGGAITPLVLSDLRIGGAMILFWTVSLFGKQERVSRKDLAILFSASLFAITLNQGSFILGVSMTSPTDASIITTSMPLWAMILAAFILKEPITWRKVMGIAFGAAGALMLILGSRQNPDSSSTDGNTAILGDLLVLFAQLCYALYIVLYKNFVNRYSLTTIMKWMFTFSFLCMLPFSADELISTDWTSLNIPDISGLTFIVVGGTFISYMFIVVGQKRLRPTVAGMYNYIQPLVACIVAVCWGMDSFNATKVIAILLIFSGVYLVTSSRSHANSGLRKTVTPVTSSSDS